MAMKNGIEDRKTAKGVKRYRGVVKVDGKLQRSPWCTYDEARAWRSKALGQIEAGTIVKSSPLTLRAAWAEFIAGAEAGTIMSRSRKPFKPATLRGYRRGWAKIDPELGAHKLTAIKRADVQAMVDTWVSSGVLGKDGKRQPVAASTISNTLDPLRVIFRRAVARDLVTVDPTEHLELPGTHNAEPMRFASKAEAVTLLAALPETERALWTTAFYAGLRRGELRALRCTDLDWPKKLIRVSRSWDDSEGEQTPKTKGSNRAVPMVPEVERQLKAHIEREKRTGSDLVFGRTSSDPFIPTTARSRALKAWEAANAAKAKKLGRALTEDETLRPIGLHQCRHTFASLMIAAGCNAKALSVVMGHSEIGITFNRYGHLMPESADEVRQQLGDYLAR